MKEKLVDCHAHLIFDGVDPNQIVEKMEDDNLFAIVSVGTSPSDIKKVLDFAKSQKNIFASIGFHPEYADQIEEKDYVALHALAKDKKVVAIGECGLDYHYRQDNKEVQKAVFVRQIQIAKNLSKPLMIHLREAEEDAIEILREHANGITIVVHCFSAVSEEVTKAFVRMGAYISFAGNLTYKKFRREDALLIPKDRLLVETDSPFLAPEPVRGTKNCSANVHYVASKLAQVVGEDEETMKKQLRENARRVFGI